MRKMGKSENKMCCDSHTQNIVSYLIHNDVSGCLIRMNALLATFMDIGDGVIDRKFGGTCSYIY